MSDAAQSQTADAVRSRKLAAAEEKHIGMRWCSQGNHFAPIADGGRFKRTKALAPRWICKHCLRKVYGGGVYP